MKKIITRANKPRRGCGPKNFYFMFIEKDISEEKNFQSNQEEEKIESAINKNS